ncbi:MAG: TetR/AcrR family transcriptional regulator C-terminal domain-containing protein [Lachnospiraceae bacterium]|nr:TetR/AcrR family transcriptional regulator C-terminal domain-containing protein [Lachnospiraceae bacterium]
MENKKDLTKELLADCFKELMMTTPFDKITIKMITSRAGLIRPTFYKHFQDKYEVLEWIFKTEISDSVDLMIRNHMELDAIVMLCRGLDENRKFYRRAFQMEPGPNSFDQILTRYVYSTLMKLGGKRIVQKAAEASALTPEVIATFYTYGLVNVLKDWILNDNPISPEEFAQAYKYLLSHSVLEMLGIKN